MSYSQCNTIMGQSDTVRTTLLHQRLPTAAGLQWNNNCENAFAIPLHCSRFGLLNCYPETNEQVPSTNTDFYIDTHRLVEDCVGSVIQCSDAKPVVTTVQFTVALISAAVPCTPTYLLLFSVLWRDMYSLLNCTLHPVSYTHLDVYKRQLHITVAD